MLSETVILLIVMMSVVSCQINGEFWWLNNDLTKLKHGTAPPPKFDDVNELDTDETAKIVFRDEVRKEKYVKNETETLSVIHFKDETELAKPIPESDQLNVINKLWGGPLRQIEKNNNLLQNSDDKFQFVFPSDDNLLWIDSPNLKNTLSTEVQVEPLNKISSVPKLSHGGLSSNDKNPLLPENICSFIKKSECIHNDGTVYEPWMKSNMQITIPNTQIICCILPITTTARAKIIFPDTSWSSKRHKRSNVDDVNPALKQRNTLMNRKYTLDDERIRVTTPATRKKVNQKVFNSDEYSIDPYWNIKNSNIRNPHTPSYQDPNTGYDYGSQNYGDDYTVELPKPGLIGLYSDHKKTEANWVPNKNKDFSYDSPDSVDEEEFETLFGYSTIDPRQDQKTRLTSTKPFRRRPLKLTSASSAAAEPYFPSSTISFHSNPDFQVLPGFKLLNLVRHKNRLVRKTAEINKKCVSNELKVEAMPSKFINYEDEYEHDSPEANVKQKLFNECGKPQINCDGCEKGLDQGVLEYGGHPWIAMVVLTKSEHSILCYATLVHSRVAVTAADCVYGKSPGDVSIITGVRNLDEDFAHSQRRMATIAVDADYAPERLRHNFALLHWLRPLTLDAKVQPACLADPHKVDSCVFVGWGGYDQEMHSDLRWQRASILASQKCNERLSKLEVSDAICAAVESRGTVTGVGGPLLCQHDERWSAVGVAVWRNDVVIILPMKEWVKRKMISLRIQ